MATKDKKQTPQKATAKKEASAPKVESNTDQQKKATEASQATQASDVDTENAPNNRDEVLTSATAKATQEKLNEESDVEAKTAETRQKSAPRFKDKPSPEAEGERVDLDKENTEARRLADMEQAFKEQRIAAPESEEDEEE